MLVMYAHHYARIHRKRASCSGICASITMFAVLRFGFDFAILLVNLTLKGFCLSARLSDRCSAMLDACRSIQLREQKLVSAL